jgi:hypothetical protein
MAAYLVGVLGLTEGLLRLEVSTTLSPSLPLAKKLEIDWWAGIYDLGGRLQLPKTAAGQDAGLGVRKPRVSRVGCASCSV